LNGEIQEGRPIEKTGAHTTGHNFDSLAVCYVGGVEKERSLTTPTVDCKRRKNKGALKETSKGFIAFL
jgi:hypothetical protein